MVTFVVGRVRPLLGFALILGLAAGCGGGSGGAGPDGAGQGLVLVSFLEAAQDNVPLNRELSFRFSEPVDASTITAGSLQILEGPAFGLTVSGAYDVDGALVTFRPRLPTTCSLSDAGLKPATQYRVILVGAPEEFCIRNSSGQPLESTGTFEFGTRPDTDPDHLEDQIPATPPSVISTTPADGEAAVAVQVGNEIVVEFTESLDPCSVNDATVICELWEVGAPGTSIDAGNGRMSGFDPVQDSAASPYSWGASNSTSVSPAQTIPAAVELVQDYGSTQIRIRPGFGQFPENALVVVRLTFGIMDFGGSPLAPTTLAFTTENLGPQSGVLRLEFDSTTPVVLDDTTADVNTARSPGLAQAWMLFSGDGDNGSNQTVPAFPRTATDCTPQPNDLTKDVFNPSADVVLNTGSSDNTCANSADGSTAGVWEFQSFTIPSGVTVRIIGVNPAIILVQGDVTIQSGGTLRARGDGQGGSPQGRGGNGYIWTSNSTSQIHGGTGVAGGGDGGEAVVFNTTVAGRDGYSGYGSPDGRDVEGGHGAGEGGTIHITTYPNSPGTSQGGGGGGHAEVGGTSTNILGTGHANAGATLGGGGSDYVTGSAGTRMLLPSSGSGGGAGGNEEWGGSYAGIYSTGGGGGGAGGGFVDITSSGDVNIYGTIDVAGSSGGSGGSSSYYAGPGGGGGGSGGGIRILTARDIYLSATTVLTAAGGSGGNSPNGSSGTGGPQNHGAAGSNGRIVLEDSDSVITGLLQANVLPGDGAVGFYRGIFDSTRFLGGAGAPVAVTGVLQVGPLSGATLTPPSASDGLAYIPTPASRGIGMTSIVLEARGYGILPDADPDLLSVTGWYTVGYYRDSGSPTTPTWVPGANPGDVPLQPGNVGAGIGPLDGSAFLQFRLTFHLPITGMTPTQPGPYLDWTQIRFTYDQ